MPTFHQLTLPPSYTCIEFISDLHLEPSTPSTFTAWQHYMQTTQADALFILGDLFESWVGDDILGAPAPLGDFERQCAQTIHTTAQHCQIFFIHGNRDFLIQQPFAQHTAITLLPDPTLLLWQNTSTILTHGDLLCTDDLKYQQYRQMIHTPQWQQQALAMPLQLRLATAQQMRQKSIEAQKHNTMEIMDVNPEAVLSWMQEAQAQLMIHGHTHRPHDHQLTPTTQRIVLTDWDLNHPEHKRAQVLRWQKNHHPTRIQLV